MGWTKIRQKYTGQVEEMPPSTASQLVAGGMWEYVKPAASAAATPAATIETAVITPLADIAARILRPIFSRGPRTGR